jgi:UDP-N-acetylglucosamine 2-epimerase (non-hydrolysing)
MHRREWLAHADLDAWTAALAEAAAAHPALEIVWPVHPHVEPRLPKATLPPTVKLVAPLPYKAMIALLMGATGVLTDSGGLCEEAATLGIPTAILRNHNDRPEAVEAGVARAFAPTPAGVADALRVIAHGGLPRRPTDVFGTAESAAHVARALLAWQAGA